MEVGLVLNWLQMTWPLNSEMGPSDFLFHLQGVECFYDVHFRDFLQQMNFVKPAIEQQLHRLLASIRQSIERLPL